MAKKKDISDAVPMDYQKMVQEEINKQYKGVFFDPSEILDNPFSVIPFSPSLDLILGGGISEGSLVLIAGQPKTGKTSSILSFCANAQKEENGGRHVYYYDVEYRLQPMHLKGILGLDLSKMSIIRSSEDRILNAEDVLNSVDITVKTHPGCIIILDSISALCPESEYVKEASGQIRSITPKLLSHFTKKLSNILKLKRGIVILVQHMITNTSGYGATMVADSGVKVAYASDFKLAIKGIKPTKIGERSIGQEVEWECTYSALGVPPGGRSTGFIRYGIGIDRTTETIKLATDLGVILAKGAWMEFEGENYNGKEKLYQAMVESPELYAKISSKVNSIING